MPIYLYKGYDVVSGANKRGKIEAESIRSARQKLKTKDHIIASDIKEEVIHKKGTPSSLFQARTVPLQDLAIMTRQFATLQSAHVPLDECLKALTQQVENIVLRNTLAALKDAVSEGKSLGDSAANFPNVFSKLFVNMVKAGEQSGKLDLVLERLADYLEYQVTTRGKIFSALAYPSIMIMASVSIVVYLMVSVVPGLEKVFANNKVTLPWYSAFFINVSKGIINNWFFIIAGCVVIYFLIKAWYNSKSGRERVDSWLLTLPIFGAVIIRMNVSKFTKTLATLLSSGVPIITALEITKNIIGNVTIANAVTEIKKAVQEGESLWSMIEKTGQFPSLVVYMVRTGEKTGELEKMLRHVADAYDAEVERKIQSMISVIEPLMIIFMGGFTVLIAMSMLIPMLSVMNNVR